MEKRLLRVQWIGPLTLEDVANLDDSEEDVGVYQIYGGHVVFGTGSLLYVGRARAMSFAARFHSHYSWLRFESGVTVHVGRLHPDDYPQQAPEWPEWCQLVDEAEALTIHWHSPPYNSRHIVRYGGRPLRLHNDGQRGRLLEEYTDEWQPRPPDDL